MSNMNDRIQELIEQCKEEATTYFDGRGNVTETYFDKYKFADLIIRECAKAADDWYQNAEQMHYDPATHILGHFGIY